MVQTIKQLIKIPINKNLKQHKGYKYHLQKMFSAQEVKTPTNNK